MASKRKLSVEEHLALAEHVMTMDRAALAIFSATSGMPKTSRVRKALARHEKALSSLRCWLDTEWHQVASNEVFAAHGHVYYRRS